MHIRKLSPFSILVILLTNCGGGEDKSVVHLSNNQPNAINTPSVSLSNSSPRLIATLMQLTLTPMGGMLCDELDCYLRFT